MAGSLPGSVVFITGTFIANNCWDEWRSYFESKGYTCVAPAWPFKNASPEELRNRPAADPLASNALTSLTDYFASIIKKLPVKPILVGHSLGGLVVQLLLQRELGIAGVAIHSFPPQGVNRFWLSCLKTIWEATVLFSSGEKTYLIPFDKWSYAIANGMEYEQQKELYYLYAIPESKKIIREALKCTARIDFKKSHAPLLFTSGGNDMLIPSSLNYSNYKKYVVGDSVTDYEEFKTHGHLVFKNDAWKKEADHILYWLSEMGNS